MGLNLKHESPLPYPFDLRTEPVKCWDVLDDTRLRLPEPTLMLVFDSTLIVSLSYRQMLTVSHYVPDQILIQFATHEVRIHGEWMTDLYLTLLGQRSCVVYEWRKDWGKRPVRAKDYVREILLRPTGSEPKDDSKESVSGSPTETDEVH